MTMSRQVNISQNANDIQISTTQNRVVVIEGGNVDITVTQPVTSVVEVLTGPMGPKGDLSTSGSVSFTGSYVISGSLVVSGSTTSTQGFTGSLLGTSSWAINAETASYVNPLTQNVIITGSLTVSGSSTFTNIGPAVFSGSVTGRDGFTGSFLGNLEGTASYVEFSSVDGLPTFSSSVSSRIVDLENFSSSLDATFATDAQLNAYTASANIRLDALEIESGSIRSSFNNFTASYTADSASFSSRVSASESDIAALQLFSSSLDATFATDAQLNAATASLSASISSLSSSYLNTSASFSSGINANAGDITALSSSFVSFSSSYNTGSYTGSFTGDGGGLYNIPASGIVGLNLSQISSGSVSASISPDNGLQINTNTTVAGDLIIQGTASITYLNVTYESASVIYSSGSNQFGDAADDTQTLYGTVLIQTGSLTVTGSVTSTDGFTGSLFGTSSWATNAISSSYALTATSASYALSASHAISASYALTASYVNPLIQNVIITGSLFVTQSHISTVDYIDFNTTPSLPAFLTGRLHWTDDTKTLQLDTDVNNFELEIGHQSVIRGRNVNSFTLTKGTVVYINGESGNRPTFATASWEGDPSSATTIGIIAQDIINNQTGYAVTNGLIRGVNTNAFLPGTSLYLSSSGQYTDTPPASPLHEVRLGKTITQATNGTLYIDIQNGYELGELHDVLIVSASSGDLVVWNSGSQVWQNTKQLTGSYGLTGSLSATSFTGSLFGTSSWATNSQTASFAPNYVLTSTTSSMLAPYVLTSQTSSMSVASASVATSASYALTASFALNGGGGAAFPFSGSAVISGSLFVSSSTTNVLTIQGSGSAQPIFTVQGSAGQLFAITDSLSGSLFSVNDISGLPILEIFSDNTTLIGDYQAPALYTTKRVTSVAGNNVIYSLATSSYDGAFFDYVAKSGSNARAGNIMALWSGTSVNFTETTTTDFGSTSGLAFTVFISGSNLVLSGSTSTANWNIKTIIRSI